MSARHRDRVVELVGQGVAEGATLLLDGRSLRLPERPNGFFVGPCVFDDVRFGKAIAEFQRVQVQIARAATELEAARLMVYNAARLRDAGEPFLTEAAMCKLFVSDVAEHVTSLAVQQGFRRTMHRVTLAGDRPRRGCRRPGKCCVYDFIIKG